MKTTEKSGTVISLLSDTQIPRMFRARQSFPEECIPPAEIPQTVRREIMQASVSRLIVRGKEYAITAGSRGIANVDIITKAVVDSVKELGGIPFIVPAMGSHGGATAEGQKQVLEGYGITEEAMGCEIRSSMETVYLGMSETSRPVYIDQKAYNSDGIILSCRLKPHNAFRGTHESGPCKMMVIGLGKQKGAENVHAEGMDKIGRNIPSMAKLMIERAPILFAIPCIENAYDQTCKIEAIPAEKILEREEELLKFAFSKMPSILVNKADVLIVDEIGKNYSGTGVDPNITGTFSTPYATGGLDVQRTCFLDLSEASHGNALGVGLANVITQRLFDKIDMNMMYPNCITSTVLASARIPCVMPSDKAAVQMCIRTTNGADKAPDRIRVVRIPNSLHIGDIMLSEVYYQEVQDGLYPNLKAIGDPDELVFNADGALMTPIREF